MSYTPLHNIVLSGTPEVSEDIQIGDDVLLASGSALNWDAGAATISYDNGDDVLVSDAAIRVSIAPSDDDDLVNKAYVDGVATGLDVKDSCRVATSAAVTLSGPGASIDGVSMNNGDRVLVKNQGDAEENGIYVFNGAASAMTRAEDADSDAKVTAGMFTFIEEGTHADQGWVLTTNNPIDLGVTELAFSQFSNAVIVSTLDSLTDVDVTGAADGALLRYDSAGGGGWADTTNMILSDNGQLQLSTQGVTGGLAIGGDTLLYRYQAGVLLSGTTFAVNGDLIMAASNSDVYFNAQNNAANQVIKAKLVADANDRLAIQVDGKMLWGDGTNAADVNLYRSAADVLKTDDSLEVASELYLSGSGSSIVMNNQNSATNLIVYSKLAGDVDARVAMQADGKMIFGDGTAAPDVNLYRASADNLETDDDFTAANLFSGGDLDVQGMVKLGASDVIQLEENGAAELEISGGDVRVADDLHVDGVAHMHAGLRFDAINAISANATLSDSTDHIVLVDSSGGAVTVTLPAAPVSGTIYQIKDSGGSAEANNITVAGNGNNIDGAADFVMGVDYQSATVIFDGAAWFLI